MWGQRIGSGDKQDCMGMGFLVRRIVRVLGFGLLTGLVGILFMLWALFGTSVAISRDSEHFWE